MFQKHCCTIEHYYKRYGPELKLFKFYLIHKSLNGGIMAIAYIDLHYLIWLIKM